MRIIRFEVYRAFHSRTFLVSLLIGCFICAFDMLVFCSQVENANLLKAWIGTDDLLNINPVFYVLLPVIACLPYGGSLYTDIKTGYEKNICVRASRLEYAFAKGVAVFLAAFVSVSLPLALNLFILAGIYPNYIPDTFLVLSGLRLPDRRLFAALCNAHPALYSILFICIDGIFAGAISLTSLSLSKAVKSHFTAVVTPMVIYIVSSTLLFPNVDDPVIGNWSILDMVNPSPIVTTLWYQMLAVLLAVLITNIFFIWILSRKRDVL